MNSICVNNIIIIKIYNIHIQNSIICAINIIILFIINNIKNISSYGVNINIFIISNNIIIAMRSWNSMLGLPLSHVALGLTERHVVLRLP